MLCVLSFPVSRLGIVVLVEEGADNIIDELVLRVGDIDAEGHGKENQRDQAELAEKPADHGQSLDKFISAQPSAAVNGKRERRKFNRYFTIWSFCALAPIPERW